MERRRPELATPLEPPVPQDLDAEERLLGALLLAGSSGPEAARAIVERIREVGIQAADFYRPSHGRIFARAVELVEAGRAVDAVSLAAELDAHGELADVGGKVRIHELAALAPAIANAPSHARIVREAAERRDEQRIGKAIVAAALDGGVAANPDLAADVRRIAEGRARGRDNPWRPCPLPDVVDEPAPQPDRLGGLLYPASLTLVSGEPSVGKSMVVTALIAEEALAGRRSIYLDFEGFASTLDERLSAAGLSTDERALVFYRRIVEPATASEIEAMAAELAPEVIAVDSYDAALATFGLETTNEDIRVFDRLVTQPLRSHGAAVVVVDHVAKSRETRGPYSIGGQSKLALVDVHLGLSPIEPLRRGATGRLKVKTHKDRHGWLPRAAVFALASHEVTGALSWDVKAEEDGGSHEFRPTVLMERVSRYLEAQTAGVSQRTVERDVHGQGAALRRAIDVLVLEAYVTEETGARGARLLSSEKPFREASE